MVVVVVVVASGLGDAWACAKAMRSVVLAAMERMVWRRIFMGSLRRIFR
jgi:hypothetical protein